MLVLKSIEEEAADCRKAFEGVEIESLVLHCHHEVLGERLNELAENRIAYILENKPENERALRLRLFRPVSQDVIDQNTDLQKVRADWLKADANWVKASADWRKDRTDRLKTDTDWLTDYAAWQKADAAWQKAGADWLKAYVDVGILVHSDVCKDCPWNGKTIFP